jgi:hypothetical protein
MVPRTETHSPPRHLICDLGSTPELAAAVDTACQAFGYRGGRNRQRVEEDLKLVYYYGGKDVAVLPTPRGRMIVAVGDRGSQAFREQLGQLSPDERSRTVLLSPGPWSDEEELVPTPFVDEAQRPLHGC